MDGGSSQTRSLEVCWKCWKGIKADFEQAEDLGLMHPMHSRWVYRMAQIEGFLSEPKPGRGASAHFGARNVPCRQDRNMQT